MKTQKTRKQTAIQSAVVFRCTDKATGKCLGYGVKSDSTEAYYHVTARKVAGEWKYFCSCPATCECKHRRAVKEVVAARKAMQQEAAPAASYDVVAEAAAVVEAAENAALDEAYAVRGKEMRKTQPREIGCDRCFERGYWQRDADGHYLCPECRAELAASARAASRAKQHATCEYCGRNHASSECYL